MNAKDWTPADSRLQLNPLYRTHRMKLGVMAFNCSHGSTITTAEGAWELNWRDTREIATMADRAGLDVLLPVGRWRGYGGTTNFNGSTYETFTWASSLAAATEQIGLFATVHVPLFHPVMAAKMAATVDHVSNGRMIVGLGAGYWEPEHDLYGIHLGSVRERAERLEESCQILRGLWTQQRLTFEGKHYTLKDAPAEPKPIQSRLPILVGGRGPERTLRTVARHADMWNMPPGTDGIVPDQWRALYEVLLQRCDEVGRDPAEIETNVSLLVFVNERSQDAKRREGELAAAFGMSPEAAAPHCISGSPAEVVERIKAFEAKGVQHFVFGLVPGFNIGTDDVALFAAEAMPHLR